MLLNVLLCVKTMLHFVEFDTMDLIDSTTPPCPKKNVMVSFVLFLLGLFLLKSLLKVIVMQMECVEGDAMLIGSHVHLLIHISLSYATLLISKRR